MPADEIQKKTGRHRVKEDPEQAIKRIVDAHARADKLARNVVDAVCKLAEHLEEPPGTKGPAKDPPVDLDALLAELEAQPLDELRQSRRHGIAVRRYCRELIHDYRETEAAVGRQWNFDPTAFELMKGMWISEATIAKHKVYRALDQLQAGRDEQL
ncbi:MAG: hypothetical protein AB7O64_10655, partial [Methylibium sp.]